MKVKVAGRIWLETSKGTLGGKGRIDLLQKVEEFGSITLAAKAMKMSYRKAWEQIDAMNKKSNSPLVIKVSGGSGGGGSLVTKEGKKVIARFVRITRDFERFVKQRSK